MIKDLIFLRAGLGCNESPFQVIILGLSHKINKKRFIINKLAWIFIKKSNKKTPK